jgi:competence ComEA-like helix-hairpin-helix protein
MVITSSTNRSRRERAAPGIARRVMYIVVLTPLAIAQVPPPDTLPAPHYPEAIDIPENLLEILGEEADAAEAEALLELLDDLRERRVDPNRASAAELSLIPGISPRLAHTIVAYRTQHGSFRAIGEIRSVEGVDEEIFADIRPYLVIGEDVPRAGRFPASPRLGDVRRGARVEVLQRVQRRLDLGRGYDAVPDSLLGTPAEPRRYLGSPERLYTRLRATYGRQLSANLTLEKDPGEPFTWDPENGTYGYDFVSFHLAGMRMGRIEALVLGDFVAEFGQGVTLWRASGFGKGRETTRPLVRRGRGIRPYASTDENQFFRGGAGTIALTPNLYLTGFASRRFYDARIAEPDTANAAESATGTVAGMPASGLHRTHAEIAQKNSLGQTLGGGGIELRSGRSTLGVVGYQASFDYPLARGAHPYQRFDFEGDRTSMLGLYGSAVLGHYYIFGEVARAPGGAIGGVGGVDGTLGAVEALALVRHYPRDLTSLHGYAFGDRNGATQNESGVYLGLRLRPSSRWAMSGYVDQYRFPWVRFGVGRPSTGHDALLFVEHRPRTWLNVYLQARTKTREIGTRVKTETGAELDALTTETRQSVRFQGDFVASRDLRLRGRIETSRYRRAGGPAESGVMLFHDLRWSLSRAVMIDGRITYFDTDSFGARLYQFENDLLGVLTNTLLSGRGARYYGLLTIRPGGPFSNFDARLKFALTTYRDRHFVGSGLDQIEGNRVRDVGVQVRARF